MEKENTLTKDYSVMLGRLLGNQAKDFIDSESYLFYRQTAPVSEDIIKKIAITESKFSKTGITGKCRSGTYEYKFTIKIKKQDNQYVSTLTVYDYYGIGINLVLTGNVQLTSLSSIGVSDTKCHKEMTDDLFKTVSTLHSNYTDKVFQNNQFKDWDGKEDYETWFLRALDSYVGVVPFKRLLDTRYYHSYEDLPYHLSVSEELGNITPHNFTKFIIEAYDSVFLKKFLAAAEAGNSPVVVSYVESDKEYLIEVTGHDGLINQQTLPDSLKGKITNIRELAMLELKKPIAAYTITYRKAYYPSEYEKESPRLKSKYDDKLHRMWIG